jgi:hypothetical protein
MKYTEEWQYGDNSMSEWKVGGKIQRRAIDAVLMHVLGGHRLKYVLRLRSRSITSSGTTKELALMKLHLK